MKPRESYRVTAVRLVEFHNLGTTTVELPEGGHLFLLGDNGSGKTTLLDAIHLVLTAGREMEFNSAARVAGAKDSGGRTYQGVVLRYNAVTGRPARESGITYAALELKSSAGRVLSLAVGLSAEGMDVAIERWGGLAAVPVADLPLTVDEGGRLRAATAAEFKRGMSALTGGHAYAHINDYADAVGERLFGGTDKYADVCKLLRTGKAYREIAARAANYDELFRQLLEDPSRETFEPLLKGLRELEESKARLEQIDERAKYLSDLSRSRLKLDELRTKSQLVTWAECDANRKRALRELDTLDAAIAAGEKERDELERDVAAAQGETARQRERLAQLRAKDASGLIDREKQSLRHVEEMKRLASEAAGDARSARNDAEKFSKAADAVREKRSDDARRFGESVQKLGKKADVGMGSVTDALFAVANGAETQGADAVFAAALKETRGEAERRAAAAYRASQEVAVAEERVQETTAEVASVKAEGESLPQVAGFASVRAALRAEMLSARAIYELLEPAPGCDAKHVALLERLLGDDFLSTWLADAQEADAVRQRVWREGGEIAVAERGTCAAADPTVLTPWLGNFLSFEESDVEAVRLVAAHLAATVGPQDADFLSVKTWSYRFRQGPLPSARPRLIGRKAREQEQARRLKASEERLAEAEKALKGAERVLRDCEASVESAKALVAALEEMRLTEVRAAQDVRLAESQASDARTLAEQAETAAETRRREVAAAVEELEDVRLKMREAGVDGSLEKKIASIERQIRTCEDEERTLHERRGGVVRQLETLAGQRDAAKRMSESAAARCGELAKAMSARLAGTDVAEYVRSACPEAVAANADFAALREKFVADAKVCEADIALRIRDAKGEAYAFSFDVEANAIADRRGTPLAEVIADETRRLEELQGVIDRKSREVFERIFMGEVMRRLCIDLMQIEGLVGRIQRKLAGRRFGSNRYAFAVMPVPEYEAFVGLVRKGHLLDASDGKDELRAYLEAHRDEIMNADIDAIPDMFDYRKWFRFQLKVMVENEEGRVIDRKVKSMGSGGEQAVPNYLLILTVAEFLYHGGESSDPPKAAPLLFDEAFYGIDAARRDQLLAFAEVLGLQLFVSSPDQDGVKREIRHSVSLIVVKDENLDVHLSPVTWNNAAVQTGLFDGESPALGMTVGEETR